MEKFLVKSKLDGKSDPSQVRMQIKLKYKQKKSRREDGEKIGGEGEARKSVKRRK